MKFIVSYIELVSLLISFFIFLFIFPPLFAITIVLFSYILTTILFRKLHYVIAWELFAVTVLSTLGITIIAMYIISHSIFITLSTILYSFGVGFLVLGIFAFDDYVGEKIILDNNYLESIVRIIFMTGIYLFAMYLGAIYLISMTSGIY